MPDQTINVDIKVNTDAINQIPKLKTAIDDLRVATSKLNSEILNSNSELEKFTSDAKDNVTWALKIKDTLKDLIENYKAIKEVITGASNSFEGWAGLISTAIDLMVNYTPQVKNFFNNIFQSDKTRLAAKSLEDYSNVLNIYANNISNEKSQLDLLLTVARNDKLSKEARIDAVKKINNISPEYLGNLTLENLKTKEGKRLVDEYITSLERKSLLQAVGEQRAKLVKERYELKEEYDSSKSDLSDFKKYKITKAKTYTLFGKVIYTAVDDSQAKFNEVAKKDMDIIKRIKNLDDNLASELKKFGSSTSEIPTSTNTNNGNLNTSTTNRKRKKPRSLITKKDSVDLAANDSKDLLNNYAKQITDTNNYFDQLKKLHKGNNATLEQLENERIAAMNAINQKFQTDGLSKLAAYEADLNKTSKDARQQAFDQLNDDYNKKAEDVKQIQDQQQSVAAEYETQMLNLSIQRDQIASKRTEQMSSTNKRKIDAQLADLDRKLADLEKRRSEAVKGVDEAIKVSHGLNDKHQKDLKTLTNSFDQEDSTKKQNGLQDDIKADQDAGNWKKEFQDKQELLNLEKKQAMDAAVAKGESTTEIEQRYKKKQAQLDKERMAAEVANQKKYLQGLDSVATAVAGIFGKNTIAARVAFKAHQAAAAAQVIIDTRQAIMGIWSADAGIPFAGVPKAIAETAIVAAAGASNLASILKQKPGFAQGGQYVSDGRGALLPGYSRTDNTNAYLRSGEAVVVSEAMRNPWARNLVSAINVAHGGRDFSIANPGRGYAIGGIFTDGGNANRYYSQPVNDIKDMANTLAYQMINNFPPIYVDVKDVNNQQNILAQTVNRVNL